MSSDLIFQSATGLAALLEAGKISSAELTAALIARARAVEDRVRAFNSFDEADALAQARASDARRAGGAGARGPLDGIPIGMKDVIAVDGPAADRARAGCSRTSSRPTTPRSRASSRRPGPSAGAGSTWTSSRWAPRRRTRRSAPTANPWDLDAGAGRLVRRQRGRRGRRRGRRWRWAPTRAARSASRRRSAASWASSRPTGGSRATASSPSPRRSTRSGRSRARSRTRPCCWAPSPATTRGTPPRFRRTCPTTGRGARDGRRDLEARDPEGVLRRGARPRGRRRGARPRSSFTARRAARSARSRCRTRRYAIARLLHHRDGRVLLEPRALRRRPLRPPLEGRDRRRRHLLQVAGRGLRRRGEAPDHPRHLRARAAATTTPTTCAPRRCAR